MNNTNNKIRNKKKFFFWTKSYVGIKKVRDFYYYYGNGNYIDEKRSNFELVLVLILPTTNRFDLSLCNSANEMEIIHELLVPFNMLTRNVFCLKKKKLPICCIKKRYISGLEFIITGNVAQNKAYTKR